MVGIFLEFNMRLKWRRRYDEENICVELDTVVLPMEGCIQILTSRWILWGLKGAMAFSQCSGQMTRSVKKN